MRLNRYIARHSGVSRRGADELIESGHVTVNDLPAELGQKGNESDVIALDGQVVTPVQNRTIMLNKPPGYITSRKQQGSAPTIYTLLPQELQELKPIGRLDKDSRGLLLLTNDGHLAQKLTNPKYRKLKIYEVTLDKPLELADRKRIEQGVEVEGYISRMQIEKANDERWLIFIREGKNRQIRKTFAALGYTVTDLMRTHFGDYELDNLDEGEWREIFIK